MKLIGIKRVDYVSQKTSKRVLGWNLYFTFPLQNNNLEQGQGCQREFISESNFDDAPWDLVESDVTIFYNKYGNVEFLRKEE